MLKRYGRRNAIKHNKKIVRLARVSVLDDGILAVPAPNRSYSNRISQDPDMLRYIKEFKSKQLSKS